MRTMRGRAGWAAGAAATILVCLSVCGCGPKQQARTAQSADRPFTVTVNRTDNGAAAAPAAADSQAAAVPRALSFEMAGFAKDITPGGLGRIFTGTADLLPALAEQRILRTWAGLRPMTPDACPMIGPDPDVAGLWYATGHGRKGVLLGPLTGEIIRDLMLDGKTAWDLTPCSVTRFDKRP